MDGFSIFGSFFRGFTKFGENLQSLVLLIFRLIWGFSFYQAGIGKLSNMESTISLFQGLGIPFPETNAYFVALVECIGGIFLIFGLGTQLWALLLAIIMVVAFLTAHIDVLKNIFIDPLAVTKESPFNFLLVMLLLFAFGPGKISLDYLAEKIFHKFVKK
ncbi:MAG: DoxX family protein [Parachlamydiaceae bacterium]|nr:DoxX family protein [Parachlamydiaceae bacterium]